MPNKDFDPAAMDQAAHKAAGELDELTTAKDVASWYAKWVMAAGYKRLSKTLLAHFELKLEKDTSEANT